MLQLIKNNKVPVLGVVCVTLSVCCTIAGFSEKMYKVAQCNASVTRYVTAEFSQYVPKTCYDDKGKHYDCSSTDYWSEPASQVAHITTVNGTAVYPDMPAPYLHMRSMYYFDNFEKHTKTELKVDIELMGERDQFNEPISKNKACLAKRDNVIIVNTWFGITYGSDF